MKRLVYVVIILFLATPLFGQVKFRNISFDTALELAVKEDKYLFISCYNSNNKIDELFFDNVYGNKEVSELLNNKFIAIRLDLVSGEGPFLQRAYNISVAPTFLVLDKSGKEISRSVDIAEYNPDKFRARIESMVNSGISLAREKFNHSLDGANDYIQVLNDNYLIRERDKALSSLFSRRSSIDNYRPENFEFYNKFLYSIFHPLTISIMADEENAVKYLGKKRYNSFINEKVAQTISDYITKGTITNERVRELVSLSKKHKVMRSSFLSYFETVTSSMERKSIEEILSYTTKKMGSFDDSEKLCVIRYIKTLTKSLDDVNSIIDFFHELRNRAKSTTEREFYTDNIRLLETIL